MSKDRWKNHKNEEKNEYDNGRYDGGTRIDEDAAGFRERKGKKMSADDLGEWIQDMVQDAVESMDFSQLSQNIRDAVDTAKDAVGSARETMAEQMKERSV